MMSHKLYPHVFRPLKIGQTEIRNRIFVPGHTTNYGENNLPSKRHLEYHRARAAGGVGLIIFEGIRVHKSSLGRQQGVNGYEAEAIPRFRDIAKAVQAEGAKIFGQVLHLGRHIDGNFARMAAWSASSIPWTATAPAPHPMTHQEIAMIVQAHADVACNLLEAGLDGIELQLAHGHLLQQFLSPISNERTDEYGGSLDNRMRFIRETLAAVRAAIGDQTMGVRISAEEFLDGGLDLDDMCDVVRHLVTEFKIDFVNVSHSAYHGSYTISTQMADMAFKNKQFHYLTKALSRSVSDLPNKPVIMSVCRYNTVDLAEAMLAKGDADMIGMARAHIADPELVNKARDGRQDETIPCIGCNQGCADMLSLNLAISCLTNPRSGKEAQWPKPFLSKVDAPRRLLVVGGGPAGLEAASVAGERGIDVTLVEAKSELGGGLNYLKDMPLRKEFLHLVDSQKLRLERSGVHIKLNHSISEEMLLDYKDDHIVWAGGAHPRGEVFANGEIAMTLEEALYIGDKLDQSIFMVDHLGTWSVASVAEHFADLGKKVTIIVPTGVLGWKISIYSSFALKQRLREKGVQVIGGHKIKTFANGLLELEDMSLGKINGTHQADHVISPMPGMPNVLTLPFEISEGDFSSFQIIGDSVSARTALEAVYEGHEAALLLS